MRSWLLAKQREQEDLPGLLRLKCQNFKYDDSDSFSSESLEDIEDESERKYRTERDGQLIYLRVLCSHDNRYHGL